MVVDPGAVDALVHILAELLDNATSFSTDEVMVTAGWHGRDLLIRVTDTGIGIAPGDLERINTRLADPGLDVDVSDRMGLIVVSRLAAHVPARVWLEAAPAGGVVAVVLVPAHLVTRIQRVYIRELPPAATVPPARPELPATGTGWHTPGAQAPAPPVMVPAYQRAGTEPTRELRAVVPRPTGPTAPAYGSPPQPEPEIYRQVRQESPWLLQQPTTAHTGHATTAVDFRTPADAGWRAASATAQPTVAGTTARGLPIRHPGAHALPDRPTPAVVPTAAAVDPGAVRAQVAAALRGLHAATPR